MANMREIRTRMKSIQDTMKITNAMYLISSSKMKKARRALDGTEPYFKTLQRTIHDILLHSPDISHNYFDQRRLIADADRKRGYIIITADKGLAGAYNHNVIKLAEQEMKRGKNNTLYILGQIGRQHFLRMDANVPFDFYYTNQTPTRFRARNIAETVLTAFDEEELDEVYLIFTEMITSFKEEARMIQLLPLIPENFVSEGEDTMYKQFTVYSPSPQAVMNHLVPNYVKGIIFGAMVEAFTAEQNARMTAMKSATDSAKDMLKDLSLLYNRARQAAITQEINEVVSGAEAFK
ncbi:ATP synthase F1 subunit gamma [Bacilliculturomica massiliensis]|uniref:ATP synthase F1 subunit gamma n=1 Tax=Bacilliculturomica massiliensis TaxID=1917867 RepID=UPI0010325527|nr:ATP synthase F1 subunit gamma [Bacilliculturomica massiliensis]